MSLMNAVKKLAIGFAIAKGMEAVKGQGGIGKVMEGLTGGGAQGGQGGGLGDMLGKLGGAGGANQAGAGGIGDLLGQLTGGGTSGATSGGLGGLGGLLGGLAGARGGAGGLEALLQQDNPTNEPDEEDVAKLMLRAMTQAARADGDIDAQEQESLIAVIRESDPSAQQTVQAILREPVDPASLAADTPKGVETQVYTMALNAINPDNQSEAQYLHKLAEGLNIQPATANEIHDSLGAPRLYR